MLDRPRLILGAVAALVTVGALLYVARPDSRPVHSASGQSTDGSKAEKNEQEPKLPEAGRWQAVSTQELKETTKSIALTLMVSHKSVELLSALRRDIPFRFEQMRSGAFRIEVLDAKQRSLSVPMEIPGLLPESQTALADEKGEVTLGDEVFSVKVPVIAVVPDLDPPFTVTLKGVEGRVLGSAKIPAVKEKQSR